MKATEQRSLARIVLAVTVGSVLLGYAFSTGAAKPIASPSIQVQATALVDEVVKVTVSGLKPNQTITIKSSTPNRQGKLWQASAEFVSDKKGAVDVSKQAPVKGSYVGVDAMGLVWSMALTEQTSEPPTLQLLHGNPSLTPAVLKFDLEIDGQIIASANLTRLFVAPNVRSEEVKANGLVAKLYEPEKGGPHPGIIVLGGSEGGIQSAENRAALLASRGYSALAVAYFGMPGLPQRLVEVPLEYLKKSIDWLKARPSVDPNRLGVLGGSKGGELALLLGATYPEIKAVVAYVPSHVVWQGIGGAKSSWTYQGTALPFVPYKETEEYKAQDPNRRRYRVLYSASLEDTAAEAKAIIPVEKINGPVMLISGKDDQLWPSDVMGERAMARFKEKKFKYDFVHLSYPATGHGVSSYFRPTTSTSNTGPVMGGTPEGYAHAQADSILKVKKFLAENLKKKR